MHRAMWPRTVLRIAVVIAAVIWGHADAEVATTVVDVPTRGVSQRFLYVRPNAPLANIVFLPGLNGVLGVANDGSIPTLAGRCAPFARTREAFAERGFAVALVDQTSDFKVRQYVDVRQVVLYMRGRDDNIPTWVVGGSGSTLATLNFAAEFPTDEPLGVIIFSPWGSDFSRAASVKRPTLVVYHAQDSQSVLMVAPLFDALTAAPVKERIGLAGGSGGEECGGHHLFMGIDAEFVAGVVGFIDKHNPAQR